MPAARRPALARLKRLYGHNDWSGRTRLDYNLFFLRYTLRRNELPGWRLLRLRDFDLPQGPRTIQAIWRRRAGGDEELLRFDVFECESLTQAHSYLVRLLAESQQPANMITEVGELGDVAFVGAGSNFVVFARGNLLLLVRNAGRQLRPVQDVALRFDGNLTIRPGQPAEPAARAPAPALRRVAPVRAKADRGIVPLDFDVAPEAEAPVYRLESRSGEVFRRGDQLMYRQMAPGNQRLVAWAMTEAGVVSRLEKRFAELGDAGEGDAQ
jgi:hypothetical protein